MQKAGILTASITQMRIAARGNALVILSECGVSTACQSAGANAIWMKERGRMIKRYTPFQPAPITVTFLWRRREFSSKTHATFAARAAHPFLCCDYGGGKVCAVTADGKIEWEYACKNPQDIWRLPNGNTLFCFVTGAIELSPGKKVVWEYKAPTDVKNEVHACQPLPDGKVMIVECGTSRIIEVDRDGKIAKEFKLATAPDLKLHNQ